MKSVWPLLPQKESCSKSKQRNLGSQASDICTLWERDQPFKVNHHPMTARALSSILSTNICQAPTVSLALGMQQQAARLVCLIMWSCQSDVNNYSPVGECYNREVQGAQVARGHGRLPGTREA